MSVYKYICSKRYTSLFYLKLKISKISVNLNVQLLPNLLWSKPIMKNSFSQSLGQGVNKSLSCTKQVWGISSLSALYCAEECKWFMIKTQADHSVCHVYLQMSRSGISNSLKAHEPLVWRWRLTLSSKMLMKKSILLRRWPGTEKPKRKSSQCFKIYEQVLLQCETLIIVKGICLLASVKDVLNLVIQQEPYYTQRQTDQICSSPWNIFILGLLSPFVRGMNQSYCSYFSALGNYSFDNESLMIIALLRRAFSSLVKAILSCGNVLNINVSGLVYFSSW